MCRMVLPKKVVDVLLPIVAKIMGLSKEDITFLLLEFDPAIQAGLRAVGKTDVSLSKTDKTILIRRAVGTLLKMFYAFFWY